MRGNMGLAIALAMAGSTVMGQRLRVFSNSGLSIKSPEQREKQEAQAQIDRAPFSSFKQQVKGLRHLFRQGKLQLDIIL